MAQHNDSKSNEYIPHSTELQENGPLTDDNVADDMNEQSYEQNNDTNEQNDKPAATDDIQMPQGKQISTTTIRELTMKRMNEIETIMHQCVRQGGHAQQEQDRDHPEWIKEHWNNWVL